jgi:hypothetical protein
MKITDVVEGYTVLPPIDTVKYQPRDGLEGPFRLRNSKVVYYDPQEGSYYDPDTDMYISYDDYKKMDEEADLPNKKPGGYYVMRNGQSISYHQDKESAEKRARASNMRGGSNATVVKDERSVKEGADNNEDIGAQIADLIRKKNSVSSPVARKNIDSQIALLKRKRDKLNEFAPGDGGDGDGGEEDTLRKFAKMWYNGDLGTQQQIEKLLARSGWEIGELESEEGGAFVVQSGDEHGNSYIGFTADDLTEGVAEANNDTGVKWFDFATWALKQGDKYKDATTNHTVYKAAQKAYKAYVKSKKQGVAEANGDQVKKVFKKNGQPVGEVGIDTEASPGNGQWYMKCYAYDIDNSGYDSYEEALEELKYCLEQGVAEGDKRPDYVVKASDKPKKIKPSMGGESPHPYQGKLVGATEAEVGNTEYQWTHGKKPSGQGSWFFVAHRGGINFSKDVEGEDYIQLHQMSYGDAKKAAIKWAKSKGHTSLFVAT